MGYIKSRLQIGTPQKKQKTIFQACPTLHETGFPGLSLSIFEVSKECRRLLVIRLVHYVQATAKVFCCGLVFP
jgi:hypothetical protein